MKNRKRRERTRKGMRRRQGARRSGGVLFCGFSLPLLLLLLSLLSTAAVNIQYRLDTDADYVDLDTLQELIERYRSDRSASAEDEIEDSMYDGIQKDPSCVDGDDTSCYSPPLSTMEEDSSIKIDATCLKGGDDVNEDEENERCVPSSSNLFADKHWGSDMNILKMRDVLRGGVSTRPPIFLLPGLASTRLVAWKSKTCPHHPLLSDIKIQDYVWLNINLVIQMGTLNVDCMKECMQLGLNQSDSNDVKVGCKLRPDEGLDAISSLAPGGLSSSLLVGGTNTVYAWLIQWLVENLGYDNNS